MKVKFLNFLTVCLVTLVVLSPGLLVLKVVWGRHIELVKTQNLSFEVNKSSSVNLSLSHQPASTSLSQYQPSSKSPNSNVTNQALTANETSKILVIIQWLLLITPIFVGLGIIVYDSYLVYRAAVLKSQIAMLERLWQQSIEQ